MIVIIYIRLLHYLSFQNVQIMRATYKAQKPEKIRNLSEIWKEIQVNVGTLTSSSQ